MTEPHVTVGLLVHNAEQTLRETVDSVLAQTHRNLTLLLSDDASTDSSLRICHEYEAADRRVRVQSHSTNVGGIDNFNSVVGAADRDYFVWMSDHDLWQPEYLEACVAALEQNHDAVLAYTAHLEIDLDGNARESRQGRLDTSGQNQKARFALTAWGVPANTACVYGVLRVSDLERVRSYPAVYPSAVGPDVLLLLELSLLGEFVHVDRPLYLLRWLSDSHVEAASYLERLRLTPRSRVDGIRAFLRMVRLGLLMINTQVRGPRRKLLLGATYLLSVTHYDWLLSDLVTVGARRPSRR
jgi:glycosyltransferase involved in cell wall biosynthesis